MGKPGTWKKYYCLNLTCEFTEPGIGGNFTSSPGRGWDPYISYNTYLNQNLLIESSSVDSYIDSGQSNLPELNFKVSSDGINWTPLNSPVPTMPAPEAGWEYYYPSIVSLNGDSSTSNQEFYLYYTKRYPDDWKKRYLLRRKITLGILSSPSPSTSPANTPPTGYLDSANCTQLGGWTCDPDDYSSALLVHFYKDGPAGSGGIYVGNTLANTPRPDIASVCGGNANHGFSVPTFSSLKDGNPHTLYAYAINTPTGLNPVLNNWPDPGPKVITCNSSTPSPSPSPDTANPSVTITFPANGATVQRGSTVNITAIASDNTGVAKVEFYINGSLGTTDTSSPYSYAFTVPNPKNKTYVIVAKAYDAAGNNSSASITIKSK